MAQTKACPNCNRPVPINVPRCPYCRSSLAQEPPVDVPKQTSIKNAKLNALLHGEAYTEEDILTVPVPKEDPPQIPIENTSTPTAAEHAPAASASVGQEDAPKQPTDSKSDTSLDINAHEKEKTEKKDRKEKKAFFRKKPKTEKAVPPEESTKEYYDEEYEDAGFDANSDGYYDDVLPALAEQINRLPTENAIRIVFTLLLVVALLIIAFSAM